MICEFSHTSLNRSQQPCPCFSVCACVCLCGRDGAWMKWSSRMSNSVWMNFYAQGMGHSLGSAKLTMGSVKRLCLVRFPSMPLFHWILKPHGCICLKSLTFYFTQVCFHNDCFLQLKGGHKAKWLKKKTPKEVLELGQVFLFKNYIRTVELFSEWTKLVVHGKSVIQSGKSPENSGQNIALLSINLMSNNSRQLFTKIKRLQYLCR